MNPLATAVRRLGRTRWLVWVGKQLVPLDTALQRRTRGRLYIISLADARGLLLTTTGRRSGQPRSVPLLYVPVPAGYVVAASNFGGPHHPAWSANLLAAPTATVVLHGRTETVTARLTSGDERARMWALLRATWPAFDTYADRSGRDIRVFILSHT